MSQQNACEYKVQEQSSQGEKIHIIDVPRNIYICDELSVRKSDLTVVLVRVITQSIPKFKS